MENKLRIPLGCCAIASVCWILFVILGLKIGFLYLDNQWDWVVFLIYTSEICGGCFLLMYFIVDQISMRKKVDKTGTNDACEMVQDTVKNVSAPDPANPNFTQDHPPPNPKP